MTYHIRNPDLNHFGDWVKESSKIVVHVGLMIRSRTESNLSTINDDGKTIDDTKSSTKQAVSTPRLCKFCKKGDHPASTCEAFRKMNVSQRWHEAETNKLCFRCLGKHSQYDCKIPEQCGIDHDQCTKRHHKLLHRQHIQQSQQPQPMMVHVDETTRKSLTDCTGPFARAER
jgi:hypothetical protein